MPFLVLRLLSVLTAALWLYLLSRAVSGFAAGRDIASAIVSTLVVSASTALALVSLIRPNRFAAISLLATSTMPSAFLTYEFFSRLEVFGFTYFLNGTAAQLVSPYIVVPFMALPFLWGGAYLYLRRLANRPIPK